MAYFTRSMDGIERGGKIAADVFCVALLGTLAVAYLGPLYGVGATVLVTLGLLIIDRNVPDTDKSAAGVVR